MTHPGYRAPRRFDRRSGGRAFRRPAMRFAHSQSAFLFTVSFSFRHQTPAIVRQIPAVSAGGNPAYGQSKPQNWGVVAMNSAR